jgi:hypothetical protein
MPGLQDLLNRILYREPLPESQFAEHRITRMPVVIHPQESTLAGAFRTWPPSEMVESELEKGPQKDPATVQGLGELRDLWAKKPKGVIIIDPKHYDTSVASHEAMHGLLRPLRTPEWNERVANEVPLGIQDFMASRGYRMDRDNIANEGVAYALSQPELDWRGAELLQKVKDLIPDAELRRQYLALMERKRQQDEYSDAEARKIRERLMREAR